MTQPNMSWHKLTELANRGFDRWAVKSHNKKAAALFSDNLTRGDLIVCIAIEIERGFRETSFEERQARIYTMESRIGNQRRELRSNWEIIEMRCKNWMGSPEGRRRYIDLFKRHQALLREVGELRASRPPLWKRILNLA